MQETAGVNITIKQLNLVEAQGRVIGTRVVVTQLKETPLNVQESQRSVEAEGAKAAASAAPLHA